MTLQLINRLPRIDIVAVESLLHAPRHEASGDSPFDGDIETLRADPA